MSQGPTGYALITNITNTNGSVQFFVNATLVLNITDANISLGSVEPGVTVDSESGGNQEHDNVDGYIGANVSGDWFNVSNEGGVQQMVQTCCLITIFSLAQMQLLVRLISTLHFQSLPFTRR